MEYPLMCTFNLRVFFVIDSTIADTAELDFHERLIRDFFWHVQQRHLHDTRQR